MNYNKLEIRILSSQLVHHLNINLLRQIGYLELFHLIMIMTYLNIYLFDVFLFSYWVPAVLVNYYFLIP